MLNPDVVPQTSRKTVEPLELERDRRLLALLRLAVDTEAADRAQVLRDADPDASLVEEALRLMAVEDPDFLAQTPWQELGLVPPRL